MSLKLGVYTDRYGDIIEVLEIIEDSRNLPEITIKFKVIKNNKLGHLFLKNETYVDYFGAIISTATGQYVPQYNTKLWKVLNGD